MMNIKYCKIHLKKEKRCINVISTNAHTYHRILAKGEGNCVTST